MAYFCSCSPVCTVLLKCMLRPWILTAILDSMLTVQTHPLHSFQKSGKNVSGLVVVFCLLQSRSVVLDYGHTPGQHAQCLNTPTTHIQMLLFYLVHGCRSPGICEVALHQVSQSYGILVKSIRLCAILKLASTILYYVILYYNLSYSALFSCIAM